MTERFSNSHPYQKNSSPLHPRQSQSLKAANSHFKKKIFFNKNSKTHRGCKTALCGRRASFLFREAHFIGLGKERDDDGVGGREGWECRRRGGGRGGDKGGRIPGFKKQHCPERWKGTDGRGECGPQSPEEKGDADRSCCFPLMPECSSVRSRGQRKGGTDLCSQRLAGASGVEDHWEKEQAGGGEGKQLWPQRAGRPWGRAGFHSLLFWPGQERSAQHWSLPWQRWRKGQWLGPRSSPTPKGTGGGLPGTK